MARSPEAAMQQARRQSGCGCWRWVFLALLTVALALVVVVLLKVLVDREMPADVASEPAASEASTPDSADVTRLEGSPEVLPPSYRRMLRLDRGTVLRQQPRTDAAIVLLLPDAALLQVLDQQGNWYRVDGASLDVDRDVESWARLEDGPSRELRVQAVWQMPRPSRTLDASRRALAVEHLSPNWTSGRCGPYELLTDVTERRVLEACHRLADGLDEVYRLRFGVAPVGTAGETLILFRHLDGFRAFVRAEGLSSVGYAGHANASGGYLALYLGDQDLDDFFVTLVHELTHLVSWRALGGPLPRWLSEGLADGIGESASVQGIDSPSGIVGLEAEAQRFWNGSSRLPSSLELASLEADQFDARPQDRHYEHSSLLVRFLLLDDALGGPFRDYLTDLASGQGYEPETFRARLGVTWDELDRRFSQWLRKSSG